MSDDRPAYAQYADKHFVSKAKMEANLVQVGKWVGDMLAPFQARIAELESEVALLRAVGTKRRKSK
jgi:hypothetical protein